MRTVSSSEAFSCRYLPVLLDAMRTTLFRRSKKCSGRSFDQLIFRSVFRSAQMRSSGVTCRPGTCEGVMAPRLTSISVLFALLTLLAVPARGSKRITEFVERTIAVNGVSYKYQVFVPDIWTPKRKWPVILFLHGADERGSDGLLQTDVGLPHAVRLDRNRFPFLIVIPQCREEAWWAEAPMDEVAMKALDQATNEFNRDSQHTYLTGLSMGGYGSWYLAGKHPRRFAALVPICGGILRPEISRKHAADDLTLYNEAAKKIGASTSIWIFHGDVDATVPVAESRRMEFAMKALGGEVRYTEYPGIGHGSWDKAYDKKDLVPWLLSKSVAK
jgi:predicted peptidase